MATTRWEALLISVAVTLGVAVLTTRSFGGVAHVIGSATATTGEYFGYQSLPAVLAAIDATTIPDVTDAATAHFSQAAVADYFYVVTQDTSGADTINDAITAAIAAGCPAWAWTIASRADADILAVSSAMEARTGAVFVGQANNTDLHGGALSASTLAALAGRERTAMCFHESDSEYYDVALSSYRLGFSVDKQFWEFKGPIGGVDAYTTALSEAQLQQLEDNYINAIAPFGSVTTYSNKGLNMAGRPLSEILTKDWLEARISEGVAALVETVDRLGQNLAVNRDGHERVRSVVEGVFRKGFKNGRLDSEGTFLDPVEIDAADISSGIIRITGHAKANRGASSFDIALTLSAI